MRIPYCPTPNPVQVVKVVVKVKVCKTRLLTPTTNEREKRIQNVSRQIGEDHLFVAGDGAPNYFNSAIGQMDPLHDLESQKPL